MVRKVRSDCTVGTFEKKEVYQQAHYETKTVVKPEKINS